VHAAAAPAIPVDSRVPGGGGCTPNLGPSSAPQRCRWDRLNTPAGYARLLTRCLRLVCAPPQLEDWYLKASPKGAMPVLLHAGKPVVEEDAVVRYADKTFPGDSIAGDAGALDKFAKLAHDVPGDHFVATAFLKDNHPGTRPAFSRGAAVPRTACRVAARERHAHGPEWRAAACKWLVLCWTVPQPCRDQAGH
jgi:hypothetical protein